MDFPTPEEALKHYVEKNESTIQAFLEECKVAILAAGGPCTFEYKTDLPGLLMTTVVGMLKSSGWSLTFLNRLHDQDYPSAQIRRLTIGSFQDDR